jgi:hypothetical protein
MEVDAQHQYMVKSYFYDQALHGRPYLVLFRRICAPMLNIIENRRSEYIKISKVSNNQ